MTTLTPITCTYVFRIDSEREEDEASPEGTRRLIQSHLGSEHEVLAADRMRFNTNVPDKPTIVQHVIRIKTCAPEHVATKLMGNSWAREEHILFKALPNRDK